jgi:Fe-S cluster assembly protein SufD
MEITKSWFYKIENIGEKNIKIWENLTVIFFDNIWFSLDLEIWKNSKVEFYGFLNGRRDLYDYKLNSLQSGENSVFKLRYLMFSKNNLGLNAIIKSEVDNSKTKSDMRILSILWENGNIDLDWIVEVNKDLWWVEARLEESSLFLWESWKVSWIPTLLVKSEDVKASHACKIDKIDSKKMFYLRSRWIDENKSKNMLLESYFVDIFRCINMVDRVLYEELKEVFFDLIRD